MLSYIFITGNNSVFYKGFPYPCFDVIYLFIFIMVDLSTFGGCLFQRWFYFFYYYCLLCLLIIHYYNNFIVPFVLFAIILILIPNVVIAIYNVVFVRYKQQWSVLLGHLNTLRSWMFTKKINHEWGCDKKGSVKVIYCAWQKCSEWYVWYIDLIT